MASVQSKVSRAIILVLLCALGYIMWTYGRPASHRESVKYSSIECVMNVCIENSTAGNLCTVGEARISEILIESDPNNSNIHNIRVIPSNDRCQ